MSWVFNDVRSVGTTSQEVLAPNGRRISALLVNDHASQYIWLKLGYAAVANEGIRLNPGGGSYEISLVNPWFGRVFAIASDADTKLLITEVTR